MALLLLVRHGQSTWNAERRWQGWADPPLSALGERQAVEAAAHLRPIGFEAVTASDLERARRTAEILAAGIGFPPEAIAIEPAVRERDVGQWSGLTADAIEARWPGQVAAWRAGQLPGPPGGELDGDFRARVRLALERISEGHRGAGPVLVVTHGGVVRALERLAGVEALTLPNLGGRWFDVDRDRLVAGDPVGLTDPGTPVTAPVF